MKKWINENFPPYISENLYWRRCAVLKLLIKLMITRQVVEGPDLQLLRKKMLDIFTGSNVLLTGSGRAGLGIFLKALRRKDPDRNVVLIPFYVCSSVIEIVKSLNFHIRYVGIETNLSFSHYDITRQSLEKVAAVIVPHIYGYPADIKLICKKIKLIDNQICIIDDAAAAFHVIVDDKLLGTYGDIGVISFSQGKLLNSSGGGLLLVNNSYYYDIVHCEYKKLLACSTRGKIKDLSYVIWRFGMQRYSDSISYWIEKFLHRIDYQFYGMDKKLTNIDAAIINNYLHEIEVIHDKIVTIHNNYIGLFNKLKLPFIFPQFNNTERIPLSSKLCCALKCPDSETGAQKILSLRKFLRQEGIKVGTSYRPAANQHERYYELWESHSWLKNILILPVNYKKNAEWHNYIVYKIDEFCRENKLLNSH